MALALGGLWGCGIGKGDCGVAIVEVAGGDSEAFASPFSSPSLAKTSVPLEFYIPLNDPCLASDAAAVGDFPPALQS